MKLEGKVAVITGAGSGIGRAAAKLFAKEGAKVVVADIDSKEGQETAQQIQKEGGTASYVKVDVTSGADNKAMVDMTVNLYGRLDILFANAGICGVPWDDLNEEKWRKIIDINLTGPFLAAFYAVPQMKKQGGGNLLFTSSEAGLRAHGSSPAYTASKAGVIMLSGTLASRLGKDNIRVNAICPGPVETNFYAAVGRSLPGTTAALGRLGKPEEVANLALFLVSDDASYVSNAVVSIDGGMS